MGAYGRCPTRLSNPPPAGNGAYPGYIQLRPQTGRSLPAFGVGRQSSPGCNGDTEPGVQHASRRIGKASPSVCIFARDPLCKNTCRYCRCRPCDVGVEHDDHTCYVTPTFFTQKLWSFSPVSVKEHWTCACDSCHVALSI